MKTFYWYDYETFDISPKIGRIAQFAGIRTDENLNILYEKMLYCKPTNDCLPSPEACAVTGISPQLCTEKGVIEHQFMQQINTEFSVPDTCTVGYNSIRFDDEFTRYSLYRNFIDPYAWHWKNGNTRWDILDVVRLCYALKKEASLKWVYDENGKPIFRLDQLSLANGIEHSDAHDALADVRATIAIAKIIKDTQPQLFAYAFSLRQKKTVEQKIKLFEPMLHTSGMYSATLSCTRLAVALAYHPEYNDRVIVFNLDQDPSILLESDKETLKKQLFTKQSELPEGVERLQIKDLIFNKSPMFVPNIYKLEPKIIEQLQIDMDTCLQRLEFIKNNQTEITKIVQDLYYNEQKRPPTADVDQSLYDGFMDNADRRIGEQIQTLSADQLKTFHPRFKEEKLSTLLMHFKARNYPDTLTQDEQEDWFEIVQGRVQAGENGYLSIDEYSDSINTMRQTHPDKEKLWQQLEEYAKSFF
ncbi:exodeoxyribonuclease I [Bathymodiolus thermophilus thioautotrophic gill symbiont]|uniref:Exodeoxyribonuclease I n=1 Tax=Bathymodiolus thermophilus thioautotrophic gill symbiont TaxID=2360 RepID=A0A1J5UKE0_9GAMM|nr:exodeoxyribonuclease I [Bathymodiolus thermophilus thioautotrophic gill symbiont]OIR24727.1 exodeoxyribonuclease I [Bathymodiolus thermophilus thioautotrophic gill symbiont]